MVFIIVFLLIFVIGLPLSIAVETTDPTPAKKSYRRVRRGGRRRKTKGFIGSLMSQKSSGVMCGPGGVSTRGKRRR